MKANRALILAPTSSSAKKLFYNGNFAGKIDTAGKLFLKNSSLNGHYRREAVKIVLELCTIFENLLKLWMIVMKRT